MKILIQDANIILPNKVITGWLIVEEGKIADWNEGVYPTGDSEVKETALSTRNCSLAQGLSSTKPTQIVDAKGLYLSPGFIDLHVHGGGGYDFTDWCPDSFIVASDTHMRHGVTSIVPTLMSASYDDIIKNIDYFKATPLSGSGPNLIGLHLEGPYLAAEYKGAMDDRYLRNPDPNEYQAIIERAEGNIVMWTIAPELKGALEMGSHLIKHEIIPSIGHSGAEYAKILEAYHCGFHHITHLYSAMSTIVRKHGFRYPGVLESGFIIPEMTVQLIADGCHIPLELLEMTYRFKGASNICLITDAIRCAGTDTYGYSKDGVGNDILIEDDVAKLPDRSAFAGSIATADRLIRVMKDQVGVPIHDCIAMICQTPAKVLRLDKRKGEISTGFDADLILFDDNINIKWVMVNGHVTHSTL